MLVCKSFCSSLLCRALEFYSVRIFSVLVLSQRRDFHLYSVLTLLCVLDVVLLCAWGTGSRVSLCVVLAVQ